MLFGYSATNSVKCVCPGKQTCNITCTQEMETSFSKETYCFETMESKTKTCLSLPITQGTPWCILTSRKFLRIAPLERQGGDQGGCQETHHSSGLVPHSEEPPKHKQVSAESTIPCNLTTPTLTAVSYQLCSPLYFARMYFVYPSNDSLEDKVRRKNKSIEVKRITAAGIQDRRPMTAVRYGTETFHFSEVLYQIKLCNFSSTYYLG